MSAGLGKTASIHKDLMFFGLLNLGAGYEQNGFYSVAEPEAGVIVNAILDLKVVAEHSLSTGRFNESQIVRDTEIQMSFLGLKDKTIEFGYLSTSSGTKQSTKSSIGISLLF